MEGNDGKADNEEEITILVGGQPFTVRKSVICEHSDYYRAVLSGNFADSSSTTFKLDNFDADTMGLLMQYMDNTLNLDQHSRQDIIKLGLLSNYLQTTGLVRRIEDHFCHQLTLTNCLETIDIADKISSIKLQRQAAALALLSFDKIEPEYIPSIDRLYWYLSHPYLQASSELDVFNFGYNWMTNHNPRDRHLDILKILLCCLDLRRLNYRDCIVIQSLLQRHAGLCNSREKQLVDCLLASIMRRDSPQRIMIANPYKNDLLDVVIEEMDELFATYSESLYNSLVCLIESSPVRKSCVIPLIHVRERHLRGYKVVKAENHYPKCEEMRGYSIILKKMSCDSTTPSPDSDKSFDDYLPDDVRDVEPRRPNIHAYTGSKPAPWLEIPLNDLSGWSLAAWGMTKLVVVGGMYTNNGLLSFMTDVWVYDTITKQWANHGVELPRFRYAGVAILENSLYIVALRWNEKFSVLSMVYDLELRTFREIARFPLFSIKASPVLCAHEGDIYGIGDKVFYKFMDHGIIGEWRAVVSPTYDYESRPNFIVSYAGYIYYVEMNDSYAYHKNTNAYVCRFKPGLREKKYIEFFFPPIDLCCTGKHLIAFGELDRYRKIESNTKVGRSKMEKSIHYIAVEKHISYSVVRDSSSISRLLWREQKPIEPEVPHGQFYNNGRCCAIWSIDFEKGPVPVCPSIPTYHQECFPKPELTDTLTD